MYTIRHIDASGKDKVVDAVFTSYDPQAHELTGHGANGVETKFNTGSAFVMNDNGKTVAAYNFQKHKGAKTS